MKKILFLSPLPPPYYGSAISSEMCLDILINDREFNIRNIKLNYSSHMSDVGKMALRKIYGFFIVFKSLFKQMKTFRPEIIYYMPATSGFGFLRDYIFLSLIRKLKSGELIIHLRTQFKIDDWHNSFKRTFIKQLLTCDKLILLGPELFENLNGSVEKRKIFILPNALPAKLSNMEFETIQNTRRKNKILNLLFLSNLEESKGWVKLLEACKMLLDFDIQFICHFAGDWRSGNEKRKFYKFLEQNKLIDKVIYHGRAIGKEKNNLLSTADILIFPTENDTFGRVIIEAMEYGLPVISNRIGTIPSIIDNGKTGYILERNAAEEIFDYVMRLNNSSLRISMGNKSRERFLEKFTKITFTKKFIDIITQKITV